MIYNRNNNYCTFSPDKLFGVNFNYACYLHDRQYRNEVKKRTTRKQADKDLRRRIFYHYEAINKLKLGWIISTIYYYAVRLFSRRFWI